MDIAATFDEPTPIPLLEELAVARTEAGWERFVYLYEPFLVARLRRYGLQHCDELDLIQEVFAVVLRRLPEFRHNGRSGAFRAWLRAIVALTMQHYFDQQKRRPTIDLGEWATQLADDGSPLSTTATSRSGCSNSSARSSTRSITRPSGGRSSTRSRSPMSPAHSG